MRKTKTWSFLKHILLGIAILLLLNLANTFLPLTNGASSIGIIGGADGPTSIYLPLNMKFFMIRNIIVPIIIFIAVILLYKPLKRIIERDK